MPSNLLTQKTRTTSLTPQWTRILEAKNGCPGAEPELAEDAQRGAGVQGDEAVTGERGKNPNAPKSSELVKGNKIHPDDAPTVDLMQRVAEGTSEAAGIKTESGHPITVKPSGNPSGLTSTGRYYRDKSIASLLFRSKNSREDGGQWHPNPLSIDSIAKTLLHEMAHENVPKSEGKALDAEIARIKPFFDAEMRKNGYEEVDGKYQKIGENTRGDEGKPPVGEPAAVPVKGKYGDLPEGTLFKIGDNTFRKTGKASKNGAVGAEVVEHKTLKEGHARCCSQKSQRRNSPRKTSRG